MRIERARAEGLEVWADQYPYAASATGLVAALLPAWAQAGGRASLQQKRLADPATRAKIRAEMAENLRRRAGADRIQFRRVVAGPIHRGQDAGAGRPATGADPVDVAIALVEPGSPAIVSFGMLEDDVRALMRSPGR